MLIRIHGKLITWLPSKALVGDPKFRHGLAVAIYARIDRNPQPVRRRVNEQKTIKSL